MPRFAIITSEFNLEVTNGLKAGAVAALKENGTRDDQIDFFDAPGAYELPLLAQTAAETKRYAGVIALGCVIKGDTAHFEFISLSAAMGLQEGALRTRVPIGFGVLTTYNEEQALIRSRQGAENKGREAALAVLKTVRVREQILNG